MGAREDIAAAASSVDGVSVSATYRQVTKTGEGYVRLGTVATSNGQRVATWEVLIVLGQDLATAETWHEGHVPALFDALKRQLYGVSMTFGQIQFDTTLTNGVVISGTREYP